MVEGQMNYTLMLSLKRQALIKTAITLWNHDDISFLIAKYNFKIGAATRDLQEWQKVEDKVMEKVQDLLLPESMKKKVSDIIKPIGFEILTWRKSYEMIMGWSRDPRIVRKNLNNLCWTQEGTFDRKKTAEAFIRDENLDIAKRYRLACIYCIENSILMLWNKIPEDHKIYFYQKEDPIVRSTEWELVVFWTYYVKGEVTRINNVIKRKWQGCTPYQYAFEFAASDGNKVATEYFFQKLTSEEREESLVRSAGYACDNICNIKFVPRADHTGVLCFLLSQMNEEQQVEVFKKHPFEVLSQFLYWPRQDFFMESANRMWSFLPEMYCNFMLIIIVEKVIDGYRDYNYQNLLRVFWQQSPRTHKEAVIKECVRERRKLSGRQEGKLLENLFLAKDKESIKLILESATTSDREKMIFSRKGKKTCVSLLYNDEMDLLEFFVQECLPSKHTLINFRDEFERTVICSVSNEEREKEEYFFDKFYQLVDDLIDKRSGLEEGSSAQAERVCSFTNE